MAQFNMLFVCLAIMHLGTTFDAIERTSVEIHGSIETSLVRAIGKDGPAIAAQIARLLRWQGDIVRDVHPNDQLTALYTRTPVPFLQALAYQGAAIALRAYAFESQPLIVRYYDAEAVLVEPVMLDAPVQNYIQITETVQTGQGKRRHLGMDFKGSLGMPVVAPWGGTVTRVNWLTRVNGYCVELMYGQGPAVGKRARFLHLDTVVSKPGQVLVAGTQVGTLGSTGRSSAPHLHYEIRGPGRAVHDPLKIHGTRRLLLGGEKQLAFERRRNHLDRLLEGTGSKI